MKLINISNHNSNNWSKEQNIPANATTKDVILIAYDLLDKLTDEVSMEDELNIMLQVKRTNGQSILDCELLYTNYRKECYFSVCTMESDLKW